MNALASDHDFVRRKAAEIVGYYADDPRLLDELARLAETDPAADVRKAAGEARDGYQRKLQLFAGLKN